MEGAIMLLFDFNLDYSTIPSTSVGEVGRMRQGIQ